MKKLHGADDVMETQKLSDTYMTSRGSEMLRLYWTDSGPHKERERESLCMSTLCMFNVFYNYI